MNLFRNWIELGINLKKNILVETFWYGKKGKMSRRARCFHIVPDACTALVVGVDPSSWVHLKVDIEIYFFFHTSQFKKKNLPGSEKKNPWIYSWREGKKWFLSSVWEWSWRPFPTAPVADYTAVSSAEWHRRKLKHRQSRHKANNE